MLRRVVGSVLLVALGWAFTFASDDQPAPPKDKTSSDRGEAVLEQERLKRQFEEFKLALLNMAQRLERSSRTEDRERAAVLKQAIAEIGKLAPENKFDSLVRTLKKNKSINLDEVKQAMDDSRMVADDIRAILAILMSDNRDAQLKAEKERLQKLLKMLDQAIKDQKIIRAQTEAGRTDKNNLGKGQEKVTKSTENIAKAMKPPSDPKDGQGSPKSGQPKDGQPKDGQPKPGQPKDGQPKDGQPKDGQPKEGQPKQQPPNQEEPPGQLPGKKQVEDAIQNQNQAKKKIEEEKKDDASKEQDEAIKKLEEVRKKWEELLRQLREEELERRLANLQNRCERMLAMQIEVYEGTVRVEKAIVETSDRKPTRTEEQRSLQLSDREQLIVREAGQALQLLEEEGSAVAFTEILLQARDDMQHVQRRLGKVDVGAVTQTIEQDIIASLKEMIEALKKAQQEIQNRRQQQNQQQQSPPNPSLIDLLAELKIIRSLQIRVNNRTQTYARQYKGEQANDPDIQKELGNLAQRQLKIFEVTNNIARGKNK